MTARATSGGMSVTAVERVGDESELQKNKRMPSCNSRGRFAW